MPVKIEKGAKVGDNNAIGNNASVKINHNNDSTKADKTWFGKHPWLSAIICSLIAGIILLLDWDKIFSFIKGLFGS
ncbi:MULTISPECIES: hypothetical protein [Bacillaceae]|uniref:Uncharacterized protein n=1 Tax=Evansella alkalicola TaxID=745819 RepID=A0ABS6JST1_9BACI|nr:MULTISPECIES: hypothetical protein [Bacillaceae]MBU9721625.1 hypothetical protein [Bacillus alkalicola]